MSLMPEPQTTPDPDPTWVWRLAEKMMEWDANRNKLHQSVITYRTHALRERMAQRYLKGFLADADSR